MKQIRFIIGLALLTLGLASCEQEESNGMSIPETKATGPNYHVLYTDYQLKNWNETGSPYLENELDNSSSTFIDPAIPSQEGVFKPYTAQTKAFGVNPQQNRFWTMIRLKLAFTDYNLKGLVVEAISRIQSETNIRFYNAINDPDIDPTYGFKLPNVYIRKALVNGQTGSSNIGRLGEEQFISVPGNYADWGEEKAVGFIMRALCNVAGMYNEQQRNDRDSYVIVNTANVPSADRYHFNKITSNFYSIGYFDDKSITLAGTNEFGANSIKLKNGATIEPNFNLSTLDRRFLNYFYLPYVGRTDVYRELDTVVFDGNNRQLTESERLDLQAYLNNGNPYPPTGGHIEIVPW